MIHVFIGTKAQLIKMAPVMRRLQQAGVQYNFIFSGQHKATIDDIRTEFGLKEPDVKLYDGPDITGILQMLFWSVRVFWFTLRHRKEVWRGDRNGIVLNHGDTFSTLLGTILAKVSGLKSAHVESGLRSFNLFHPFPEEITRRLTFSFSSLFFAPGQWAMDNLAGYRGIKINTQYNTLLDALKSYQASISDADVQIPEFKYGIVSIHRFENIFSRKKLERLTEILTNISNQQRLLLILHRPTQKKLQQFRLIERIEKCENIELRPRYSYFQFIRLMKNAHFVITDGGSNQEECYYLGKPCLIMRKATERKDGLGHNACLCYYQDDIIDDFIRNIDRFQQPELVHEGLSPSEIIVNTLKEKGYCD